MDKTDGVVFPTIQLQEVLKKYGKNLVSELNSVVKEEADKLTEEVNKTAPRSARNAKTHLAGSFEAKELKYPLAVNYKIWSPKDYPIVHLLEFGHINWRDYSFVKPQPFLIPAFDKLQEEMYSRVVNKIKEGGK